LAAGVADLIEGDIAVEDVATELEEVLLELPANVIAPLPIAVVTIPRTDLSL
jgi:hypothetical protein